MKRQRRLSGVSHAARGDMNGMVHVSIKLRRGLPSLRQKPEFRVIERKFCEAKERFGCLLRQHAVLGNHIHLVVEAKSAANLARFMQGIQIRLAKALNKLWRRRGSVFSDRYFARLCDAVHGVKAIVRYVINNARRHGVPIPMGVADPYSSGPYYVHWHSAPWSRYDTDPRDWPVVKGELYDYQRNPIIWVDESPGWVVKAREGQQ